MFKISSHPTQNLELAFLEDIHRYYDSNGNRYQGITTLIKSWFPQFDSLAIATACSKKESKPECFGKDPQEIVDMWAKTSKDACDFGNDLHSFAEYLLESPDNTRFIWKGEKDKLTPQQDRVIQAKECLVNFIDNNLLREYEILSPEFLIFSPDLKIATMIDVLARHKKTGDILIGDWKSNRKIDKKSFYNRATGEYKMGLKQLDFVQDSNYQHYALQVNLCQRILEREGYFPRGTKFIKKIYHIHEDKRKKLDKFSIKEYTIRDKKKAIDIMMYVREQEVNNKF